MKPLRFLVLAVLFAGASPCAAQARQSSRILSCAAAAQMVQDRGAVLFDTSPTTFDRYVRDGSFCPLGTILRPEWIATRDKSQCNVGYICAPEIPQSPANRL